MQFKLLKVETQENILLGIQLWKHKKLINEGEVVELSLD